MRRRAEKDGFLTHGPPTPVCLLLLALRLQHRPLRDLGSPVMIVRQLSATSRQ